MPKFKWYNVLDLIIRFSTRLENSIRLKTGRNKTQLLSNIPYVNDGKSQHLLDVWLPNLQKQDLPVVFYIHGGGFATCSKDTHQSAGRLFSERGFLTFVINYHLDPCKTYPTGIQDCCLALRWVWENLENYGGDKKRIILAGESAGANLATMMAILGAFKREESWCQDLWNLNISPLAVLSFCGWNEPLKFDHHKSPRRAKTIERISRSIFTNEMVGDPNSYPLMSVISSSEGMPDRPLPPHFISVGTSDPVQEDSNLLRNHLEGKKVKVTFRAHKHALHAYPLIPFSPGFRQVWKDMDEFLQGVLKQEVKGL